MTFFVAVTSLCNTRTMTLGIIDLALFKENGYCARYLWQTFIFIFVLLMSCAHGFIQGIDDFGHMQPSN